MTILSFRLRCFAELFAQPVLFVSAGCAEGFALRKYLLARRNDEYQNRKRVDGVGGAGWGSDGGGVGALVAGGQGCCKGWAMSSLVATVEYDDGDLWIGMVKEVWTMENGKILIVRLGNDETEEIDVTTTSVYLTSGERLLREWISPNRREEKSGVAS